MGHLFQIVETYKGITRIKMVDSYKKCQDRAKQLKLSKQRKHGYKIEIVAVETNEKFNTKTPGFLI